MATIYVTLFLCLIGLLSYVAYKPDVVISAEAGKTEHLTQSMQDSLQKLSNPMILEDEQGNLVDIHDLIRVNVSGICMTPIGISDGDEVLVRKTTTEVLRRKLKAGDILLIRHPIRQVYRLRIFDKFDEDGKLVTYRYTSEGRRHNTSRNHVIGDVIGVVEYVIPLVAA